MTMAVVTCNLRARSACARTAAPRNHAGAVRKTMRPKKIILCVDDNEQALSVRKFMLETRGYRVLATLVPDEALEVFRQGGIDLVLSDLTMPRMDGNELARRMKEIAPEVPILLVSGSVKAYERAACGDCFLPKGACSPLDVLDRVRMMLARKRGPKKGHFASIRNPGQGQDFDQPRSQGLPAFAS
jgi:two-component system response regulator CpxR